MRGFIHVEIYTDCGGNNRRVFIFHTLKKGERRLNAIWYSSSMWKFIWIVLREWWQWQNNFLHIFKRGSNPIERFHSCGNFCWFCCLYLRLYSYLNVRIKFVSSVRSFSVYHGLKHSQEGHFFKFFNFFQIWSNPAYIHS